jgi:radical SAM superfamily enzyme YgiQ (UPF0313 family)
MCTGEKQLAKAWPAKVKVLGGAHATYIANGPHEQFKRPSYFDGFDFLMVQEAEDSFREFCDGWDKGDVSKVSNLCWFNELGIPAERIRLVRCLTSRS